MNLKIIFMLTCLNVLVIAPRSIVIQIEDSHHIGNQQEYLEELYDSNFVRLLNLIPTLAAAPVHIVSEYVKYLINEFHTNEDLLNLKKVFVKRYCEKMQEIQCINGLFVLHVLKELKATMHQEQIGVLKNVLNQLVPNYMFYLTRMLSMLHKAKWDAYPWQIEIFTFVAGLDASDANYESYRDHFKENHERLEKTVYGFVTQCVKVNYLVPASLIVCLTERNAIYRLVDKVIKKKLLDKLYKRDEILAYAYDLADQYTVSNLMLMKLHSNHEIVYDWSNFAIKLKTNNVERRLTEYLADLGRQQLSHRWELDPILGNKYNVLISECIHLTVVYFTWFHIYTYHTVQSRTPAVNESEMQEQKNQLLAIWHVLVIPLKIALRTFRFDENINWSAMNDMMTKIYRISTERLAAREQFTRNYFCQAVENLGLAKASDVNRQLKNVKVEGDYSAISDRILENANMLHDYIDRILDKLGKNNGAFVRLIVSAEGNETFITRTIF